MASKPRNLATTLKTAIAVSGLALMLAVPASAAIRLNTTGGTSCKGSSGFGATVFYFSNQTAENTSGSAQYLTCHIPVVHPTAPTTPNRIEILFANTQNVERNITCALQSGYEVGSSSADVTTAIYNLVLPANGVVVLDARADSTPAIPAAVSQYDPYTLTCLIPPGGKLGALTVRMPGSLMPEV